MAGVGRGGVGGGADREAGGRLHDHHGLDGSQAGGPHLLLAHQQRHQHCLRYLHHPQQCTYSHASLLTVTFADTSFCLRLLFEQAGANSRNMCAK